MYNQAFVTPNVTLLFGIERSKDASGNDTGDGVFFLGCSAGGGTFLTQYVPFVGATRAMQANITVPVPNITSLASGNVVGFAPILPFGQNGALSPSLNFLVYCNLDTAVSNMLPITIYGNSHTYYTIGLPFGWAAASGLWTSSALAIRFE